MSPSRVPSSPRPSRSPHSSATGVSSSPSELGRDRRPQGGPPRRGCARPAPRPRRPGRRRPGRRPRPARGCRRPAAPAHHARRQRQQAQRQEAGQRQQPRQHRQRPVVVADHAAAVHSGAGPPRPGRTAAGGVAVARERPPLHGEGPRARRASRRHDGARRPGGRAARGRRPPGRRRRDRAAAGTPPPPATTARPAPTTGRRPARSRAAGSAVRSSACAAAVEGSASAANAARSPASRARWRTAATLPAGSGAGPGAAGLPQQQVEPDDRERREDEACGGEADLADDHGGLRRVLEEAPSTSAPAGANLTAANPVSVPARVARGPPASA